MEVIVFVIMDDFDNNFMSIEKKRHINKHRIKIVKSLQNYPQNQNHNHKKILLPLTYVVVSPDPNIG